MLTQGPDGYRIIDTPRALASAVRQIGQTDGIAFDLEADSMYHYREKVCLLQIATAEKTFVVDPLQLTDLSPLKPVMADLRIRKVFHGADYDIRSLYRDFGIEVHHLFDTEMASRFLGIRESGLDAVLQGRFGVRLDKKYQRKDWSKRPLPEAMMAYAAGDVHYLLPLAAMLEKELRKKGRLAWVQEECDCLSRVRPPEQNDAPLFLAFKGAGRLRPRHLAALEALLQLRRKLAEAKDRPLFKIFSNKSLLTLAAAMPANPRALAKSEALSPKQISLHGDAVLKAIRRAQDLPDKKLPVYPRQKTPRLPARVPERVAALKAWRDRKAQSLELDPGLMLSKALMQAIALRHPQSLADLAEVPDLRRWRHKVFGRDIVRTMQQVR